jgi:hypothetical protein
LRQNTSKKQSLERKAKERETGKEVRSTGPLTRGQKRVALKAPSVVTRARSTGSVVSIGSDPPTSQIHRSISEVGLSAKPFITLGNDERIFLRDVGQLEDLLIEPARSSTKILALRSEIRAVISYEEQAARRVSGLIEDRAGALARLVLQADRLVAQRDGENAAQASSSGTQLAVKMVEDVMQVDDDGEATGRGSKAVVDDAEVAARIVKTTAENAEDAAKTIDEDSDAAVDDADDEEENNAKEGEDGA